MGRTMETDGIMIWNGKKYDRRPCEDYPDFTTKQKKKKPAGR
jgi:hypothetical protein